MPDITILFKIVVLTFIGLLVGFSIVVFNQVRTMNKIFLEVQSSEILKGIAGIIAILSISLFIAALVIL
ncbi:MAG: DUF5657 family protein [Candidatus Levyibacteriota bacterium]